MLWEKSMLVIIEKFCGKFQMKNGVGKIKNGVGENVKWGKIVKWCGENL